ncbi:MAG: ABC transporter substrate-binding protein [Victivallales bacterium]|jgi:NitT/TauT family transport system substrate-binding protein
MISISKSLKRAGAESLAAFFLLVVAGVSAPAGSAQNLEPATVTLHWQHQSQFAGYYMAHAKGFYSQEGLDVSIMRGGPDVRVGESLRSGKTDFASFMLSSALEERANGLPLVDLAQVVNRSNFLLVAWRNPAEGVYINDLSDLNGRRITVWQEDFRAPYLALFASKGVHPVILPQYYTLSLFLHRGAAACSVMRYNEYHTLRQNGLQDKDIRIFSLHELGIRLPEDGIYCLDETWRQRPETCRKFVRASLKGWMYARDHEEETLNEVMKYVRKENLPTNRMHMKWMLREILASIFPEKGDDWVFGKLSRSTYDGTREMLIRHGGLKSAPNFEDFVKDGASND